uniref:Uncharacterized protein n=1 Tax=Plectus sambesii TaxID=2011161 RepID=A0A914W6W5_9BILA
MLYTHSPVYELADFSISKEKGSICVVQFNQLTFILIMLAHCERGKFAMRRIPSDCRCFSAAQRRRQDTESRCPSQHGVQLWHFSSRDTDKAFLISFDEKVSDEMHFSLAANNNSSLAACLTAC